MAPRQHLKKAPEWKLIRSTRWKFSLDKKGGHIGEASSMTTPYAHPTPCEDRSSSQRAPSIGCTSTLIWFWSSPQSQCGRCLPKLEQKLAPLPPLWAFLAGQLP
eukprot:2222184-Amphidinium_carterae.1